MNSDNDNSVQNILKAKFSALPLEVKTKIKTLGRPMPNLNLVQVSKKDNRTFTRRFNKEIYKKNNWICGCNVTNLLYCFPIQKNFQWKLLKQ